MLFIAGTHTNIGKTYVATGLIRALRAQGINAQGLKPLISGWTSDGDPHTDTAEILRAASIPITPHAIQAISPWRYQAPLSVVQAAEAEGRSHTLNEVVDFCLEAARHRPHLIIESAGGLMSPITRTETNLDWLVALQCPVVLVSGNYLGSLNHTLSALAALDSKSIEPERIILNECTDEVSVLQTADLLSSFTKVPVEVLRREQTPCY